MSDGDVNGLGFLGVRIEDVARFEAAASLYRDTLGLPLIRHEPGRLAWFRLGDGSELHLYGPADTEHTAFGDRPCVGLVVDDVMRLDEEWSPRVSSSSGTRSAMKVGRGRTIAVPMAPSTN